MIKIKHKGNFKNTERFFAKAKSIKIINILDKYGKIGVEVLSAATPINSGKTAKSWGYEIEKRVNGYSIYWTNSNNNDGYNIAILINYGHGTGNGGYVESNPFISPAIKPIFQDIADAAWKEVTSI